MPLGSYASLRIIERPGTRCPRADSSDPGESPDKDSVHLLRHSTAHAGHVHYIRVHDVVRLGAAETTESFLIHHTIIYSYSTLHDYGYGWNAMHPHAMDGQVGKVIEAEEASH